MITLTPEDLELMFWMVVVAFIAAQFIYDLASNSLSILFNHFKKQEK